MRNRGKTEVSTIKKARPRSKCPDGLDAILERVNRLIPKDSNFERRIGFDPTLQYFKNAINEITDFGGFVEDHREVLQKVYDKCYAPDGFDAKRDIDLIVEGACVFLLANEASSFGLSENDVAGYFLDWFEAYVEKNGIESLDDFKPSWFSVEEEHKILEEIIQCVQSSGKRQRSLNVDLLSFEAKVVISESRLKPVFPPFFEILSTADLARLRICELCDRIFWAKRIDTKTCSVSCHNSLRQQKFRNRNREAINEKRRANYAYKNRKTGDKK